VEFPLIERRLNGVTSSISQIGQNGEVPQSLVYQAQLYLNFRDETLADRHVSNSKDKAFYGTLRHFVNEQGMSIPEAINAAALSSANYNSDPQLSSAARTEIGKAVKQVGLQNDGWWNVPGAGLLGAPGASTATDFSEVSSFIESASLNKMRFGMSAEQAVEASKKDAISMFTLVGNRQTQVPPEFYGDEGSKQAFREASEEFLVDFKTSLRERLPRSTLDRLGDNLIPGRNTAGEIDDDTDDLALRYSPALGGYIILRDGLPAPQMRKFAGGALAVLDLPQFSSGSDAHLSSFSLKSHWAFSS
jgi:hypothetical protein